MNCCANCFNDNILKEYIELRGVPSKCDYCDTANTKCIKEVSLYNKFKNVFDLYCHDLDNEYGILKKEKPKPESLVTLLQQDWNPFNDELIDNNTVADLISNISLGNKNTFIEESVVLEHIWVRRSEKYHGYFSSKDWDRFCEVLKHRYRFFYDDPDTNEFNVEKTFNSEVFYYAESIIAKSSTILYRGRDGYIFNKKSNRISPLHKRNMGIPDDIIISNGRANPHGINYLYTAEDIPTVLAEIRAQNDSIVSVAYIAIQKDLRILDLTNIFNIESPFRGFKRLREVIESVEILKSFSRELSKPINPKYAAIDYIPTQFICELVKSNGFDGIKFRSSLGQGNNIVLFNDKKIKIVDVQLIQTIQETNYDYLEI